MASCKAWNEEMAREFSLYKRVMWPIGSWPLDRSKNFAKFRALFVAVTQTIMVAYLSMEIGCHNGAALDVTIDHFVLAACGVLTVVKILFIRLHRDDLSKNLQNAASNWTYAARQDHVRIMLRYAKLSRFVFFFQMCSSYIIVTPLIVRSLLSFVAPPFFLRNATSNARLGRETRVVELPHEMICPFNARIACFGMYVLQTVQLISTATGNVGSDVFLFGVCMHLCGQLEVLGLEWLRFHEGERTPVAWNRAKLIALVDRHCLLLRLAKDIASTLDVILIIQLIVHASLICLIGMQFITSLAIYDFILVARTIMSFNVIMIQIFLYSYMGETLSSKTQEISRAIYLSKWYDLPTNAVRNLYFIIARATVPVRIKAGQFHNVDYNSFKNILKASASYFSVLQIMLTQ